jgi:hypothetical protein
LCPRRCSPARVANAKRAKHSPLVTALDIRWDAFLFSKKECSQDYQHGKEEFKIIFPRECVPANPIRNLRDQRNKEGSTVASILNREREREHIYIYLEGERTMYIFRGREGTMYIYREKISRYRFRERGNNV